MGNGYIKSWISKSDPMYSMVSKCGYILEHRLVMARHLGRPLKPWEVVHHKNGIRGDNRIENLELFSSRNPHQAMTGLQKYVRELEDKLYAHKDCLDELT